MNREGGIHRWRGVVAFCGLLVLGLFAGVFIIGTRFAWLAPLVFSPPQVWPSLLLALAMVSGWRRDIRCALALGLASVLVAWLALGWRYHGAPTNAGVSEKPALLRVLTWNQGQHYEHSAAAFIAAQRPDVIALQDAPIPVRKLQDKPEFKTFSHIIKLGEFALLSRYPILHSELVPAHVQMVAHYSRMDLVAARFVIDFNGRSVVIYSVHTMSPRYELDMLFGIQKPYPSPPPGGPSFWVQQRSVIEQLLAKLDAETLPLVVLGDWNMPPLGVIYDHMRRGRLDAHAEVGSGAGFTCPGDLWTPLTLGKPWLRIDYILTNRDWQPLSCVTESASHAQHCAVAGLVRLR